MNFESSVFWRGSWLAEWVGIKVANRKLVMQGVFDVKLLSRGDTMGKV